MARPSSYNEEVQALADEYAEGKWAELGHAVPSVVGLAVFIKVASKTVYNWGHEYPAFLRTLKEIEDKQHLELASRGLKGDYNPTITKLMLHNHGYSEKTQSEISGKDGGPIETDNVFRVEVVSAPGDS